MKVSREQEDTRIGVSEDLWVEKELATVASFLTAQEEQISEDLREVNLIHFVNENYFIIILLC